MTDLHINCKMAHGLSTTQYAIELL